MNIAIEARSLSAKGGGIKTYTHQLIANMLMAHEDVDIMYSSKNAVGSFPNAQETLIPLASEILLPYWLSVPVANHVRKTKPSVAHYTKAAIPYKSVVPTVVTIYDIIPVLLPETQSILRRAYWPSVLRHAANHADHIMTISECSKLDIIEHFGVREENITVTELAIDATHFHPVDSKNTMHPYILFVGTRDARKNISSLIRAFARIADTIPHNLVIAGKQADKRDNSMETAASLGLQNRIEFRDFVPYGELPQLYSDADLFVWPSIYEGWGFPPQEAMACGTPVIVSNGGSLPEVVGDAGIVVPFAETNLHRRMEDEAFTRSLSKQMLSVLQDTVLQQRLREHGLLRATLFSWKHVAEKTWSVYEKLVV